MTAATHIDAERRYSEIRSKALSASEAVLNRKLPELKLSRINKAALEAFKAWENHPKRRVDWDWFNDYGHFKFRYPKRFEAAVWHKNKLASLTLGRPTYPRGTALRLDFIEASPFDREIAVFAIVIVAMRTYADMLGAKEIRIMNPINDTVKNYYASHDFEYIAKGDYLYKRI